MNSQVSLFLLVLSNMYDSSTKKNLKNSEKHLRSVKKCDILSLVVDENFATEFDLGH